MSAFTGVSIADGYKRCGCETLAVDARGDSGYHLLMVNGYSRTKELIPTGQSITANSFNVGGHDWLIEYYPNGENPGCADYISFFLNLLYDTDDDNHEVPVEVRFSFSLVDQVEKQMPTYIRATGETRSFSSTTSIWGSDRFIRRDALEHSADLKCDCLTIRCDVVVVSNSRLDDDDDAGGRGHGGTKAALLLPDIHQHFKSLLQNKVGADVAFQVGGETFPAHRCVLAARSTVFMAQLFGPMKEASNSNSVIQIKDMEPKVFTALLSFVYTDSFPDMYEDKIKLSELCKDTRQGQEDEMSEAVGQGQDGEAAEDEVELLQWLQGLFVAADRYDLQRLKFICVKQLSQRIGVSSVASTLALAEQHHCRGLKEACLKFIQVQSPSRLQRLMASNGWGHIVTTYPSVLNELIAMLASNQRK
ncbi:BTB/POZ and MATH domain-containing protein 3-like [Triticum urartu]|uniref:BTB/POZ and MATH domain-containing protein 3-like n=1 Tax=Triticum urartu TaxID=4572 RepID=UPI002044B98D|nr:BTB/POZ and MATH domain-containing protein 3-like [Triticum urartu]XP_048537153.1 BTB/POZ and MATH domain-containing protein 3-like [Triticum urartu]XP_048537154.1 BTB/POZ and MATH domain-containing protein 3-like [Triticum urartu]